MARVDYFFLYQEYMEGMRRKIPEEQYKEKSCSEMIAVALLVQAATKAT